MIGFDMNKKESLKNIRDMWIPEFNESTESLADEPPFAIVLVGCKYDLHRLYDPDKAPDADETTGAEIEEVCNPLHLQPSLSGCCTGTERNRRCVHRYDISPEWLRNIQVCRRTLQVQISVR